MIAKYLTQNDFFDEYIKLYATRFTMGSLRIEDGKTNLTSKERAIEIYNNMKAITQLIKTNPEYVKNALAKKGWDVDFTDLIAKTEKRVELLKKIENVKWLSKFPRDAVDFSSRCSGNFQARLLKKPPDKIFDTLPSSYSNPGVLHFCGIS